MKEGTKVMDPIGRMIRRSLVCQLAVFGMLLAFTGGCPPSPSPPPIPDASDAQPTPDAAPQPPPVDAGDPETAPDAAGDAIPHLGLVERSCANLKALGCPEGIDVHCVSVITKVNAIDAGFTNPNLVCLAAAKSRAQVTACGPFVTCKLR